MSSFRLPYTSITHKIGDTWDRIGKYKLNAGDWTATSVAKTIKGVSVQTFACTVTALVGDVDGYTHSVRTFASALDTTAWPVGILVADIVFEHTPLGGAEIVRSSSAFAIDSVEFMPAIASSTDSLPTNLYPIISGPQGISAYDVAVDNGYVGTEAQWLSSLIGPIGPAWPSAEVQAAAEAARDVAILKAADADTFSVSAEIAATEALAREIAAAAHQVAASASADVAEASALYASPKIGEIKQFASNPGAGWLQCDGKSYLRTAYPDLSLLMNDGISSTVVTTDNISAPSIFSTGYIASNGDIIVKNTGNSPDCWKSTDEGVTWTRLPGFLTSTSWSTNFASNGTSLYVAVGTKGNSHFSTDGGQSFTPSATPISNPLNYNVGNVVFDGTKFVCYSYTVDGQLATSGKFVAYSSDGSNWTTVLLPAAAQLLDWHAIFTTYASNDVAVWSINHTFELYNTTIYGPYIFAHSEIPPSRGLTNNSVYKVPGTPKTIALGDGLQVGLSNDGYAFRRYFPVSNKYNGAFVGHIGSYIVCVSYSEAAAWVSFDLGDTMNLSESVLPYPTSVVSGYTGYGAVCGDNYMLYSFYNGTENVYKLIKMKIDTTKFIVPIVTNDSSGISSYIYAGA